MAARIQVQAYIGSVGVTSTSLRDLVVVPTTQSSTFSSSREAYEQPRASMMTWQINGGNTPIIDKYITMNAVFGVTKERYRTDDVYCCLTSTSPASLAFCHIFTADPIDTSNVNTVVNVYLTQYVEFFDRTSPAVS